MLGHAVAPSSPRLVSIPRAAEALGIGRTLVFNLIKDRRLRAVKLGRRTLVPLDEIERLIASARDAGGQE
ncbi:helix-turn-helix transcriptional regulator [Microvirga massiliensis]|uniref:helix-turn-helix transcriptional regulator n=1 Tax=Microvirga massiliensis TaxID=1033741 RepID=UPI000660555D|nr:helix-turn-helix domain-containing protein [Microvirga massiliensis]